MDLAKLGRPGFYRVPDAWMRKDVHEVHAAYLARHGGERAITKDSRHHAIALPRVVQ